ncbi:MAG TPA: hypothetical protein VI279_05650 [Rhodocyclaceae bacterium]
MANDLVARTRAERERGEAALAALRAEAEKWGVALEGFDWSNAMFALQCDPFSKENALLARWAQEHRRGMLSVREDGFIYAEVDLLVQHPKKPQFFIEAVTAWGKAEALKSEPRLIEMPA